ncbi:N-methyl-L-tryptophan oxidase [Bifidobacterium myosotis]|uniref:N-methyl-L-tryptophan oxidase n=1 Tax=Bifidobacterium myosotis TaxID=1630166 RepID=A0A5M9ZGK5_9BIFI|nr:N-methyl-L-tryptophan oxidase [Bifidobacterium myosotis]KAA8825837.1 N-methyl-L-tryptophan oxidase [Bifidobacterium myosotis]
MAHVYDLIIVGTGSVGAATGYYAAKQGLDVLEIDAHTPPHTEGSHHGETRIIRHAYGEGGAYVPMVLRAQELWNELATLTDRPIFERTSVLNAGPIDSEFLRTVRETADYYRLAVDEYDGTTVRELWPAWQLPSDYQVLVERDAGVLFSENAIATYIELAKQSGADHSFDNRVLKIGSDSAGNVVMTTEQGTFAGRRAVVTAGTWVKALIPDLPVQPTRKVFAWFEAAPELAAENGFPAYIIEDRDGTQFYGFPATNGTIKIGRHQDGQLIDNPGERVPFGEIEGDNREVTPITERFLRGIGVLSYGASCTYDMSPDGDFIIDQAPGYTNVTIVTGLSGHGFKFASVLGEILADETAGKDIPFDLSPFRLNRF